MKGDKEIGEGYVEPPFHSTWAEAVHFGKNMYANFN